jgi:hypothetical protein
VASPAIGTVTVAGAATGTSVVVATPENSGGSDIGKVIYAFVFAPGGNTFTAPAGWFPTLTGVVGIGCFGKVVGSYSSTYQFGWTGSGKNVTVLALVSGQSGPVAINVVGGQANGSSGNITAPTVTTTNVATPLLLSFYFGQAANTITVPAGQTAVATAATAANGVSSALGWENLAAIGATGTRVATATAMANTGVNLVINPTIGSIGSGFNESANPFRTVPNWWTTLAVGNPLLGIGTLPLCRLQPFWLADMGVGAYSSSSGSVNITQLGIGAAGEAMMSADALGSLSGTVTLTGAPTANVLMLLIYRANGYVIKTTRTASDGTYSFAGLDRTVTAANGYMVVCVQPNTSWNSQLWDQEIPS